jgi:hypothetical protein
LDQQEDEQEEEEEEEERNIRKKKGNKKKKTKREKAVEPWREPEKGNRKNKRSWKEEDARDEEEDDLRSTRKLSQSAGALTAHTVPQLQRMFVHRMLDERDEENEMLKIKVKRLKADMMMHALFPG